MPLAAADRAWFVASIGSADPRSEVVTLDVPNSRLTYSDRIKSDESRTRQITDEELVRALTLCILSTTHGYLIDRFYIEQSHTIGHPSTSGAEVDLILSYLDKGGAETPFAMWEMKAPDRFKIEMDSAIEHQLFDTAPLIAPTFLVYSTIIPPSQRREPELEVMTIDYTAFKSFTTWDHAGRPHVQSFPPRYQLPTFKPFAKNSSRDLNTFASTSDFRAVAASLHSEFFSEHPDTELFTHVMKCLLAKIWDERNRRANEQYEFQVLLENGREESASSLFARIATLYDKAYRTYVDPAGGDSLDSNVFAPERVKSVVKGLQALSITRGAALHGDVIGAFFEEIVRTGFKQDKGMYFTHANLVWFILEALDLRELTERTWQSASHPNNRMPYVIDPACGSALVSGFALSSRCHGTCLSRRQP